MEVTAMTPIKDCNNSRDVFCESLANGPNPCAVPHVAIAARAQVAVIALRRPHRKGAPNTKRKEKKFNRKCFTQKYKKASKTNQPVKKKPKQNKTKPANFR